MAVFAVARFLPASWFFEIGAIAAGTVYINKLLNEGTFKKTYVLYEDSLSVITKYGLIEKETASSAVMPDREYLIWDIILSLQIQMKQKKVIYMD